MTSALVIIPSRLAATRLPEKPLADIAGKPMIVRVLEQALAVDIGPVAVACDDRRIFEAVRDHGGHAVMTSPDHQSGSDRIQEAANILDPERKFDVVLNLQGDVPLIAPEAARAAFLPLADPSVDIGTIMTEIRTEEGRNNPAFVKAVVTPVEGERFRALYFTRATAPTGSGPLYQHIGVYAYRRSALDRFVSLPPSGLELREKLEQLRALEDGMRIDVCLTPTVPIDVNTPEDLDHVRKLFEGR